jgi:hypothetical protein
MGYANYPPEKKAELRGRIKHAIIMANAWFAKTPTLEEFSSTGFRTDASRRQSDNVDSHSQMITHASKDLIMGTEGLDSSKAEWGGGDRTGWNASFAGDWVKPNDIPMKSAMPLSSMFPQQLQSILFQHSAIPDTKPSLSPLFTPHNPHLTTTESRPSRPKVSSNVADWIAEKQCDQQKELGGHKEQKREMHQEVITPFVPTLPQSFEHSFHHRRSQTEDALGLVSGQPGPVRPGLERRAYSQPLATPRHSPYYTPPLPTTITHHEAPTSYPTPPIHGPPVYSHPQVHVAPYPATAPPVYYHPSPPTKLKVKVERKKKGKARDKARGKARSAKKWRQTHSMAADGTWLVNLWREEQSDSEGEDDEDENPTPDSTPKQSSPAIYPLTTVVYYNQYLEQQQQSAAFAYSNTTKPSPPQSGQRYTQSPIPGGQTWTPHTTAIYHTSPAHYAQMPPHSFSGSAPATNPTHSQPVIPPPEEYTKHDRSTGTLQKLMSALKI